MLKANTIVVSLLALLAALTGYLLSGITLLGRLGMSIFYKEYNFLKTWWKGAIIVFVAWLLIYFAHYVLRKKVSVASSLAVNLISLIVAIGGLFFTYSDFRNDLSHRLMGERFHIGAYMFWLVWMGISIYFLSQKNSRQLIVNGKVS